MISEHTKYLQVLALLFLLLLLFPRRNAGSWMGSTEAPGNPLILISYLLSQMT